MRSLIAGFKVSIDGKIEGHDGYADWVAAWSEDYGITQRIDACIVGGGMYPGYENYWSAVQTAGDQPLPMTGRFPTPAEIEWGRQAAKLPHYVLSSRLNQALWSKTSFLRSVDEVSALKKMPGKDIYLMGGGRVAAALVDVGLVDELRLIVYPLIVGPGKALFATTERRQAFELLSAKALAGGLVGLTYAIGPK